MKIPVLDAFKLTYSIAKGKEPVPAWFFIAVSKNIVKVFVTDKIHDSQYCEIINDDKTIKSVAKDYIMLDIDRNIIICKHDDFEEQYTIVGNNIDNLTFKLAEVYLRRGCCIALPEWKGFWFIDDNTKKIMVLTKDFEILNNPMDEFKIRNDWKIVKTTSKQLEVLTNYDKLQ